MAVPRRKSPPPAAIQADRVSLMALRNLHDYAPLNPAIQTEAVNAIEARLREAEDAITAAKRALEAALDRHAIAACDLHNAMQEVKAAVIGQYGINSDAIQSLGRKRKVDYRRPGRRRNGTES